MGLLDVRQSGYVPKENQEFGNKKKLIGDAVCQVSLDKIVSKKTGKEWIVLRAEAIHVIPDEKGRETTVEPGDSIDKLYDPADNEAVQELADDLFTAGIDYESGADEDSTFANAKAATDGKLVYYRTWAKDKKAKDLEKYPNGPSYFQNIKILSVNKITPENSVPQLAF
jgi:hypothetical protein